MEGKFNYTKAQWCTLCALCSVMFGCAIRKSFQNPLFPREANSKGCSAFEYGLVYGMYELIQIFMCPFYGKFVGKVGGKKMLSYGVFLTGVSSICFGLLDLINERVYFLGMAFLARSLESLGAAAVFTSTFAIVGVVFKESVATAVAVLKMFLSLGFAFGPLVAGYLYQLAGFLVAFVTLGCLLLIQTMFIHLLPDTDHYRSRTGSKVPIMPVLSLPPVALSVFSLSAASLSVGFFATLEPHLRQFDLSAVSVGVVFMIFSAATLIVSPLVGYLCDTKVNPKIFIIVGGLLTIVGYSLIGPAPYIHINPTLWVLCLGLVLHGTGFSAILVAGFAEPIRAAVASGIPNDMALTGVISGLTQSAYAIGDTIGPTVSGLLYDLVGFRYAILFVIVVHTILVVSMTFYYFKCQHRSSQNRCASATSAGNTTLDNLTARSQHNAISAQDVADGAIESTMIPLTVDNNKYYN